MVAYSWGENERIMDKVNYAVPNTAVVDFVLILLAYIKYKFPIWISS